MPSCRPGPGDPSQPPESAVSAHSAQSAGTERGSSGADGATDSGHGADAGSGHGAEGGTARALRTVLYAVRSATALNRLLDTLPAFAGDHRVRPVFTLVPGSDFSTDALAALDGAGARTIPWPEAVRGGHDLVVAASPNGPLHELPGPLVLLPHGAGFNKRLPHTSTDDSASGLHTRQLLRGGTPLAALHALAHPDQLARLAREAPAAARRAVVVGDPTLDRILASRTRRERYRDALGTGGRRLVAVVSTWGPESLLARRPGLPRLLTAELPYDAYQVALVLHPNVHSRLGGFTLRQQLAPALAAGLLVARPHEEWAAVLSAADCVLTDHGSSALYPAALDLPLIGCYDGGTELLAASPMAGLLARVPRLAPDEPPAAAIDAAVTGHRTGDTGALAAAAFDQRERSLEHLRTRCYALLGLEPPPGRIVPRPLSVPRITAQRPTALAVRVDVRGNVVSVARHPLDSGPHDGHVAAEDGMSTLDEMRSAGLIHRRPRAATPDADRTRDTVWPRDSVWTAAGWTARALDRHPACRTAAAVLAHDRCVLRHREPAVPRAVPGALSGAGPSVLLAVRITADTSRGEPWVRPDPAAVVSCVHGWLEANPGLATAALPVTLDCVVGGRRATALLTRATDEDTRAEL
ncbi:translation initiation factor 2 [Streptomyces sp. NPDC059092]|uniref:translation initiation factor 2 n=1 Tax=Streptomyces sp. NPDC059092 TaxID=3346725 RepID=UPI00367BE678